MGRRKITQFKQLSTSGKFNSVITKLLTQQFTIELTPLGLFLKKNLRDYNNCHILHWKFIFCRLESQFSSVTQLCPTLCDPMNCSTPGLPVHHQLPESTQTHVHCVGDAIQPSYPLSYPSPCWWPIVEADQHLQSILSSFFSPLHQIEGIITRSSEGPHKISMIKRNGITCYFTLHTENCRVIPRGDWCWYSHGRCVSGTGCHLHNNEPCSPVMYGSHSEDAVPLLHKPIVEVKFLLLGAWRLTVWDLWGRGIEDWNALWKGANMFKLFCMSLFSARPFQVLREQ